MEFGRAELDAALAARKLTLKIKAELEDLPNESFQIEPLRVRGGDLRGLMYGLLEAAAQIRQSGKLTPMKAAPATLLRAVRMARSAAPPREQWPAFFQMLARNRFNRFQLAYSSEAEALSPENLDLAGFIARTASAYGIEFMPGVAERVSYAGVKTILALSPSIRNMRAAPDAEVCRAIREAGRLVTLDLRGGETTAEAIERARRMRVEVRIAYREGSSASGNFYWDVNLDAAPTDAAAVRKAVAGFTTSGSLGFEADGPADWIAARTFYEMWGRLSYDPNPAPPPKPRVKGKARK